VSQPAAPDATHLTSGRVLLRSLGWNALGAVFPVVLAVVSIPLLVRSLGVERFGVLGLAWTLVGYFSLFDLGLGRALTHVVADHIGQGRRDAVPALTWTAMAVLVPVGLLGVVLLWAVTPWLVERALRVPPALRAESIAAFRILALAIPFTVAAAGLRGVLEAVQAFGRVTALRMPLAFVTLAGPLLVVPFSATLPAAVGVLAAGRVLLLGLHVLAVRRAVPELGAAVRPRRAQLRALLAVSGWMTVSNVVSPLLTSLDRFVIGAVLSMGAVAHYTTAYESVTRLWLITAIVLPVLFPALATCIASDPRRAARLFDRGARASMALTVPAAFLVSLLAPEWLGAWMGRGFAVAAAPLAQVFAAAVLVNVCGQIAYTLVQSAGRADITGRLHLMELLPYAALLWLLLSAFGTLGAVFAWGTRVLVDSALLLVAARRTLPAGALAVRRLALVTGVSAPLVLVPLWIHGLAARLVFGAVCLAGFARWALPALVAADDRAAIRAAWRRLRAGTGRAAPVAGV